MQQQQAEAAIVTAVRNGNKDRVEAMLRQNPSLMDVREASEWLTLLMEAIRHVSR